MFAAPFSLPSSRPSRSFPPRNDSLIYPISVSLVKKQVIRKTVKRQQFFSSLFQTHDHFGSELFPLHHKVPVSLAPLLEGLRIDDPVIIAFHFLQSMPGCVPLQIAKLMHRAALHFDPRPVLLNRSSQPLVPIDDHQARPPQPATVKALKNQT